MHAAITHPSPVDPPTATGGGAPPATAAIRPLDRRGPLVAPVGYRDTKDPCPVHDGERWHLFGSGGSSVTEVWEILHAVAEDLDGPWVQLAASRLDGVRGDHVAAPGVTHDGERFHMFVQTDHAALGGTIEHLVSDDGGATFQHVDTPLRSVLGTDEACIYDPHPAVVDGEHLLVYSGAAVVGSPDLFLARSTTGTWDGPWERLGAVLRHDDVDHHNRRDDPAYEWGLEGAQLVELPSGDVLLNAVCFLPGHPAGTRQRVFLAVAPHATGPYRSLGPLLDPAGDGGWESGENGHAAAVLRDDLLVVLYQARGTGDAACWRYGVAEVDVASIAAAAELAAVAG